MKREISIHTRAKITKNGNQRTVFSCISGRPTVLRRQKMAVFATDSIEDGSGNPVFQLEMPKFTRPFQSDQDHISLKLFDMASGLSDLDSGFCNIAEYDRAQPSANG
ncbi:hypothetical protein [Erwinia aphidicola]|uniref:hypothetical protein n=1 Tax=Erwinia aphidicola TaxID=68334 RepID=UPI0015D4F09F|nr:hypothetical protein [uncultured Erwinia sp.]